MIRIDTIRTTYFYNPNSNLPILIQSPTFKTLFEKIKKEVNENSSYKKEVEKIKKGINNLHNPLIKIWEQNFPISLDKLFDFLENENVKSDAKEERYKRYNRINEILHKIERSNFFIIDEDVECVTGYVGDF